MNAYFVELVLNDIHHHLVVYVVVGMTLLFAIAARFHNWPLVNKLLLLQVDQILVHLFGFEAQKFGKILLFYAWISEQHLHAQIEFETIERAHDDTYERLEFRRHTSDQNSAAWYRRTAHIVRHLLILVSLDPVRTTKRENNACDSVLLLTIY